MARYIVEVEGLKVEIDDSLLYTKTDEWVRLEDDIAVVGITDYAQKKLQDIVGVEPPEPGSKFKRGEVAAFVESVKASAEVYAPLSGEVVESNEELVYSPEIINKDPYGEGWIFKLRIENKEEIKDLLTHQQYVEKLKQGEH